MNSQPRVFVALLHLILSSCIPAYGVKVDFFLHDPYFLGFNVPELTFPNLPLSYFLTLPMTGKDKLILQSFVHKKQLMIPGPDANIKEMVALIVSNLSCLLPNPITSVGSSIPIDVHA